MAYGRVDRVLVPAGSSCTLSDDLTGPSAWRRCTPDSRLGQGEGCSARSRKHKVAHLQAHLPAIMEFEKLEEHHDLRGGPRPISSSPTPACDG